MRSAAAVWLGRCLGVRDRRTLPAAQQTSFRNQSPLVAMIDDLSSGSAHDRRRLVRQLRAKGGRHEVDYVRRLREHKRMMPALARIAARAAAGDA